ncbi:hypothetical protein Ahy_A09g041714 [Arachis hypogaea]|uniref:Major facilitator superfamily (MFS) profile domain-containing protein n=1 Tax=Arachis hypogaea TaxID=3818 RepID=A0A445BDK9_ARAHY|nr:hypothetical protein Ahy_A09g041714 [Arachis hypogaea]
MKEKEKKKSKRQKNAPFVYSISLEIIVSIVLAGVIFGVVIGGYINDVFGRRIATIIFYYWISIPLNIAEVSLFEIKGELVNTNCLIITGGQFLFYVINYSLIRVSFTDLLIN